MYPIPVFTHVLYKAVVENLINNIDCALLTSDIFFWFLYFSRRALAQRCPNPPMLNLISFGGQHQGEMHRMT